MGLFGAVDSYDNKGPVGGATNPLTGAALARDRENQRAILELDGTQAYENITILNGSISPKRAEIVVDTEGGASAGTLETILTNTDGSTTLHDGMKLTLRSADPSRSVTVKHSDSEFGIQMVDGQDVILGTKWGLKLKLIANKWFEDQGRAEILASEAMDVTRVSLTEDTTFYVRSNGNDAHDGLTEAKSLKTVDAAVALLNMYDPRDKKVIIDIGQGTFTIAKTIACTGYDYMNLFLQGAGVQKTFLQRNNTTSDIYINASLSGVTCLSGLNTAHSGATLAIRLHNGNGSLRMNGRGLRASQGSVFLSGATIQFAPNDENPSLAFEGVFADCGEIMCNAGTVFEAVGNPSFKYFAVCARGGVINFYTCTFNGTAIGQKYLAFQGGVITGQGTNYNLTSLLGDTDGISSGGAVIGIDVGGSAFLAGMIVPFNGTFGGSDGKRPINSYTGQADEGWVLCDGGTYQAKSNTPMLPTPDLRNRFVIGAGGTYATGVKGGNLEHTHAVTVAPHTLTVEQAPSHNHDVPAKGGAQNKGYGFEPMMDIPLVTHRVSTTAVGGSQAHAHGASSGAASSLPPYYALAYIMKL